LLFTVNDILLGVLIAAVVLMVKSLPMFIARVALGYLTFHWVRERKDPELNVKRDVELLSTHYEKTIDLVVEPDNRLAAYKGILDSLKKNVGLYDEAVAAAIILAVFQLAGYFDAEVGPAIAVTVILTLVLSALGYWAQSRLVQAINWSVLLRVRGNRPS